MYGPGSSKKMESVGLKRKLPFLNVHTTQQLTKGEVSSLTYIIEIPLLTNGTLQYCCPPFFQGEANTTLRGGFYFLFWTKIDAQKERKICKMILSLFSHLDYIHTKRGSEYKDRKIRRKKAGKPAETEKENKKK